MDTPFHLSLADEEVLPSTRSPAGAARGTAGVGGVSLGVAVGQGGGVSLGVAVGQGGV